MTRKQALFRGGLIALIALIADQVSKHAVIGTVGLQSQFIAEMTSFFNLVLVWNRGVSFGMFSNHPEWMPIILTLVALIIIGVLISWLAKSERMLSVVALGLVIGGALGNVIDRLLFGAVIDFLDFHWNDLHWPAFNIADSTIFIGVVLLLIEAIVGPQNDSESEASNA